MCSNRPGHHPFRNVQPVSEVEPRHGGWVQSGGPILVSWRVAMEYETLMQHVWTNSSYDALAPDYLTMAANVVEAAAVDDADRVLDVGCGTGSVALTAARRGATVTGVDLTEAMLERARQNADLAGVTGVDWRVGDAAALPFGDDAFDATVSNLGHMYGDPPDAVANELVRVTRPAGRLAFTSWTPGSLFPTLAAHIVEHIDPAAMPTFEAPPFLWGDPNVVEDRLGTHCGSLRTERDTTAVRAMSPAHVWDVTKRQSGIFQALLDRADIDDRTALRRDLVAATEPYFDDETNTVELAYLLTTATAEG